MKNLKNLTAVMCTLVMLLALCACGNTAAPATEPTEAPAAEAPAAEAEAPAAEAAEAAPEAPAANEPEADASQS